jgi:hypothetical protein
VIDAVRSMGITAQSYAQVSSERQEERPAPPKRSCAAAGCTKDVPDGAAGAPQKDQSESLDV